VRRWVDQSIFPRETAIRDRLTVERRQGGAVSVVNGPFRCGLADAVTFSSPGLPRLAFSCAGFCNKARFGTVGIASVSLPARFAGAGFLVLCDRRQIHD
jgi:hypothetical protein